MIKVCSDFLYSIFFHNFFIPYFQQKITDNADNDTLTQGMILRNYL